LTKVVSSTEHQDLAVTSYTKIFVYLYKLLFGCVQS